MRRHHQPRTLIALAGLLLAGAAQAAPRPSQSVTRYQRTMRSANHLNPDRAHVVLPGVGRLSQQVVRGSDGHYRLAPVTSAGKLDRDVKRVLRTTGIRAPGRGDPLTPAARPGQGQGVLVPMMVPSKPGKDAARNTLWDVDRLLDNAANVRLVRKVGADRAASWMHARTGVWYDEARSSAVFLKGGGLSHAMNYNTARPKNMLAALGGKLTRVKPSSGYRAAAAPLKGLLSVSWTSVLGATNSRDTTAEAQRALDLHNTFSDAISGKGHSGDRARLAGKLRQLSRQHGIRSTDLFPMPRAVVQVSHYPVVDGGKVGWVSQDQVRPGKVSSAMQRVGHGQRGALQVYLYEAPAVSRLLQTDARGSLKRVLGGGGSTSERSYWRHELRTVGLQLTGSGLRFEGRQVTRANAASVRRKVSERVAARFEAVDLVLQLSGIKGRFPLKDVGLGTVFDVHYATSGQHKRSLKSLLKLGRGTGLDRGSKRNAIKRAGQWIALIR